LQLTGTPGDIEMTTISIAMATYNGARFVREQLDSLAAQKYLPAELVITDDGSNDETLEIIAEFAKTAPFPVYVHVNEQRLGYRANFMKCVSLCKSDLIAFCDQDDIWYPEKLNTCRTYFENEKLILLHHNADVIDTDGSTYDLLIPQHEPGKCRPPLYWSPLWHNPPGFTMVFRAYLANFSEIWRSSLDNTNITNAAPHDQWIFYLAGIFGTTVYVSDCLAAYRQHESNAVGWTRASAVRWKRESKTSREAALKTSAVISKNRLSALLQIEKMKLPTNRVTLVKAIELSSTHNLHLTIALEIYTSQKMIPRFLHFCSLVSAGAYSSKKPWTLGRKAMLKDFSNIFFRSKT
jgi:glycosyltransferase involved in cell wall biosynthesis